jgi:hypothetical protein
MAQTPPTLLNLLRERPEDADAWRRFDAIYRPLLTAWLRRYALQAHDCDDLVQDILQTVAGDWPFGLDRRGFRERGRGIARRA